MGPNGPNGLRPHFLRPHQSALDYSPVCQSPKFQDAKPSTLNIGLGFRVFQTLNPINPKYQAPHSALRKPGGSYSPTNPRSSTLKHHVGGCQNYGPFLGTLNIRCRNILGTQKGTLISTTTHVPIDMCMRAYNHTCIGSFIYIYIYT